MDNPDEDAVRTEQSIIYICSHSYVALEPFQPAPKDVDTPLKAEIGSSQTAGDFQPLTESACLRWQGWKVSDLQVLSRTGKGGFAEQKEVSHCKTCLQ